MLVNNAITEYVYVQIRINRNDGKYIIYLYYKIVIIINISQKKARIYQICSGFFLVNNAVAILYLYVL